MQVVPEDNISIKQIQLFVLLTYQQELWQQAQDGRSQHDNRDKAMKALVARVYDYFQSQQTEAIDSERKSKVGTGDRAEKIRTYNYPQNRVTDHRIGLTIQQLDRIIEGKLDDIITALINEDQRLKLEGQK